MIGQLTRVVGGKGSAMKLTTPEIVWHGKEPVFSADFHHCGEILRLATGGADKDVKVSLYRAIPTRVPELRGVGNFYCCIVMCADMEDSERGEEGEGGDHGQSVQTHWGHQCCSLLTQW